MLIMPATFLSISVRKRRLEPEEEDLELPDEFKPLAVSTPNVSLFFITLN